MTTTCAKLAALLQAKQALEAAISEFDSGGSVRPVKPWRVTARPPKGKDGKNWQLRFYRPEGGSYQRSAGTEDPDEARSRARAEQARLNGTGIDLQEVLRLHVEFREADPGTRPTTVRNYREAARRAREFFGVVETMDRATVERARDRMRLKLSPRTINVDLAMLGKAWRWAFERDLVPTDWPRVKRLPEQDTERRPCTAAELAALLTFFEGHMGGKFYGYFAMLTEAGSRRGETLALVEGDLDRAAGTVTFRAAITKGKRTRVAHVSHQLLERIPASEGQVFPLKKSAITRAWQAALQATGLEGEQVGPHSLRRAWITDAFEAGVPLPHIMKQVGHRDPETTLRYQRRATEQDLAASAGKVRAKRGNFPHGAPTNGGGGCAIIESPKGSQGPELSSGSRPEAAREALKHWPEGWLSVDPDCFLSPRERDMKRVLLRLASVGEAERQALRGLCSRVELRRWLRSALDQL